MPKTLPRARYPRRPEPAPNRKRWTRKECAFLSDNGLLTGPNDLLLVVEVSDTTLRFDMRTKASLYARAAIREYWVVDIINRQIIAHRDPTPRGYQQVVAYAADESLSSLARPDVVVSVAELLPSV